MQVNCLYFGKIHSEEGPSVQSAVPAFEWYGKRDANCSVEGEEGVMEGFTTLNTREGYMVICLSSSFKLLLCLNILE